VSHAGLAGRLALVWAGVILVLAVVPTHEALESAVGERETLATRAGHFAAFAVLAFLVAAWAAGEAGASEARTRGHAQPRWRAVVLAWAAATAYGGLIELLQAPLPYRSAQWSDLAIDAAGAAVGALAFRCGWGWVAPRDRSRAR